MTWNVIASHETGLKKEAVWPESGLIIAAREDSVSTQEIAAHSTKYSWDLREIGMYSHSVAGDASKSISDDAFERGLGCGTPGSNFQSIALVDQGGLEKEGVIFQEPRGASQNEGSRVTETRVQQLEQRIAQTLDKGRVASALEANGHTEEYHQQSDCALTVNPSQQKGTILLDSSEAKGNTERCHQQQPRGVPLIWDTPTGEQVVYARKKPLGVQFRAEFPLKVKREPEGHGKEIGVEVGWILKSVNGIDVATKRNIKEVNDILYQEVGEKTVPLDQWSKEKMHTELPSCLPQAGVSLVWDTPDGERTVHARKKPLGIHFNAEFPLTVKRKPVGHGEEIGIEIGWILKSVNGIDVMAMRDINDVSEILYRELGEKTVPVDRWSRGQCQRRQYHMS